MGEEPRSMSDTQTDEKHEEQKDDKDLENQVGHLEEEIAETRERLSVYLSELDHRRHRAMKLVKRGGALVLGVSAVAIAAMMILGRRTQSAESD